MLSSMQNRPMMISLKSRPNLKKWISKESKCNNSMGMRILIKPRTSEEMCPTLILNMLKDDGFMKNHFFFAILFRILWLFGRFYT